MPILYGGIKPKALVYSKMLQKYRNLFSHYLTFSSLTFSSKTIQTIDLAYVKIFERYFSHHHPDDGRGISQNVAHLNILVHDVESYCITIDLALRKILRYPLTQRYIQNPINHINRLLSKIVNCFQPLVNRPAIRCSKLTIETLKQGVKYVQI